MQSADSEDKAPANILFFVNKAVSELDFAAPLIWKIKNSWPKTTVSLVYCASNKKRILREGKFYSALLKEIEVKEYDLLDFIPGKNRLTRYLSKRFLDKPAVDLQHLSSYDSGGFSLTRKIRRALSLLPEFLVSAFIDYETLFNTMKPDVTFVAIRGYDFPGKKKLVAFTYKYGKKVVLYPHGAFISNGRDFLHYSDREKDDAKPLPNFVEYWHSFAKEETSQYYPQNKNQITCVGYPGLDSEWLQYLKKISGRSRPDGPRPEGKEIKCLFITRKFRKHEQGYGEMDYEEFVTILNRIVEEIAASGKKVKLVIKPHPANDYTGLKHLLEKSGCKNWEITYEPIYSATAGSDCVISVPSTSTLIPLMYGVPVFVINCSVSKQFETAWQLMASFFRGFSYFHKEDEFHDKVADFLKFTEKTMEGGLKINESREIRFFRDFFPDNSLDRCMKLIQSYMTGSTKINVGESNGQI